jgi:hypothetical protein
MARNDIKPYLPEQFVASSISFKTEANSADIVVGEPLKIGGTGNNFVVLLGNGEPEISADVVVGIAASDSNHTASLNGEIQAYLPLSGVVFSGKATTPANVDTAAELTAILNDKVTFDLTNGIYTVDENEGDDADHGLRIVGGNISTGDIYFVFRQSGTFTN